MESEHRMDTKQTRRDLIILVVLSLLVNGTVALLVSNPNYVDAFYYFNGGLALAEGHGFVEPYFWNTIGAPASLPAPAFGYWQPLPSFLAMLGILLFGKASAFGSAQAIFVIVASALPVISYRLALEVGERRHAWLAGLLTVFSGIYVVYWSLPESFTPFALVGAGALMLAAQARRSGQWWRWLLAGVCAGLGYLCRADGLLLIAIVGLAVVLPSFEEKQPYRLLDKAARLGLAVLGYVLIAAPWWIRNLHAFGAIQAPGGISALWITEYNDLFNYPSLLTAARFFAAGWRTILQDRWWALGVNLLTFFIGHNLVFLLPFTLIGWWRLRRKDEFVLSFIYGLLLFAAMTFAFALPGARGGWLHSAAALVPFVMAAASMGLDEALRAIARRRTGWNPRAAWRVFSTAGAVLAVLVTAGFVLKRVVGFDDLSTVAWNRSITIYDQVGATLDEIGAAPDALVISNNPPGFYARTGRGGIPLINGDEQTLLAAADDYGVTFLVIDHNVTEGLSSLYWDGPQSTRFERIETYGNPEAPTYLYRILPEGE